MQPKFYGAAAAYNKPNNSSLGQILKIIGIIVGVIILITIGYFAYSILTSGARNSAAQLVARQKVLLSFMTVNKTSISSDAFLTVNTNAVSVETSDSYSLLQGLKTFGLAAVPDAITKSEIDTTSVKTLASAKIKNQFDTAYLQLLRGKIAATEDLARTVQNSSGGTMKTAAATLLANLQTIDGQLAKLQL